MTYTAGYSEVVPPLVSTFTAGWSPPASEHVVAAFAASGVWYATNGALYCPILVPTTCVVRRVWWGNGGTVSASYNVDCGIYADGGYKPGTRLVNAGSTAQGTASELQFADVTDTALSPGLYWIALSCSSTSATFLRSTFAAANAVVSFEEASAVPLPASATPAESSTSIVPMFGFATTASP